MTYHAPTDPALDAMATPEPNAPADPVYVAGTGPGDPSYLTPRAERAIADADVVVGFDTVVGRVEHLVTGDLLPCTYDTERETLDALAERVGAGDTGVVLTTGDPNVSDYQFLGKVERAVEPPTRVIPGVSSLQVAASRARTPIEETTFVTLHKSGRIEADLERLARDVGDRHLLVLPRPFDWMPGDLAAYLVDDGADGSLDALVFERLTRDDESITRLPLSELASFAGDGRDDPAFSDLSILAVRRPVEP